MKRYGWFQFDNSPRRITNYLTDQELLVTSVTERQEVSIYCARYSDQEITRSLRFSIYLPRAERAELTLDYGDITNECITYGYWRRLDDFLVDALLCWPEFLGRADIILFVIGGWRSGVWQPKLRRVFCNTYNGMPPIADPCLTPIETSPSKVWNFFDVEFPATQANLKFEFIDRLNIPYLSRDSAIEGFQGLVPFLEREDKGAYIIFSELEPSSHRGESPETNLYYTYVDQDIFFRFRSNPWRGLELWTAFYYGFRELPARREFWTTEPTGELVPGDQARRDNAHFNYLSHPVWLRVLHALGDAWPAWGTPRRKVEIGEDVQLDETRGKVGFIGDYGPRVHHGFSAGMVNTNFELRYPDG
ncbi:MAG: hypothetical protein BWY57_01756 [Betaproteobacteria bacterium ADurb.Bin341]|nr:MAG: hypothetical protein BWY57_01756 [Betaproteobacteria bacterium ADurb.Bin341]